VEYWAFAGKNVVAVLTAAAVLTAPLYNVQVLAPPAVSKTAIEQEALLQAAGHAIKELLGMVERRLAGSPSTAAYGMLPKPFTACRPEMNEPVI